MCGTKTQNNSTWGVGRRGKETNTLAVVIGESFGGYPGLLFGRTFVHGCRGWVGEPKGN
jgi:hypothetical protein